MVQLSLDDWNALDKKKFFLYGGAFTVAVDFLIYPLELVKTRVQVEAKSQATLIEASIRGFRGVVASEGLPGLWRGFPLFTLGGLPSQGAYFFGYNWMHHKIAEAKTGMPLWAEDGIAGFFADVVAAPLWTPTEVVATRMQIQGPGVIRYESTTHAFRHILATEGIQGLFRGMAVSTLAFGPASALWWALYQQSHRQLSAWSQAPTAPTTPTPSTVAAGQEEHDGVWIDAVAGLISGSATSIVTNPLDIAKTRLQTQHALLAEYELAPTTEVRKPGKGAGGGVFGPGGALNGSPTSEQDLRAMSAKFRALEMKRREEKRAVAAFASGKPLPVSPSAQVMGGAGVVVIDKQTGTAQVEGRAKVAGVSEHRGPVLSVAKTLQQADASSGTVSTRPTSALTPTPSPSTATSVTSQQTDSTAKAHSIRIGRRSRIVPPTALSGEASHIVRLSAQAASAAAAVVGQGVAQAARMVAGKAAGTPTPSAQTHTTKTQAVSSLSSSSRLPPSSSSFLASALVSPASVTVEATVTPVAALAAAPFNSALAPVSTSMEEAVRSTLKDMTADGRIALKDRDAPAGLGKPPSSASSPSTTPPPSLTGRTKGVPTDHYGSAHPFAGAAARQGSAKPVLHKGLLSVMLHIVRVDGPGALIRGLLPRMLMQGPASAATFVAYEQVKRLSKKDDRD